MKILRLHFKNLNSLAGTWNIDLEHPAYVSDGIFTITGPTGAGKSTVLDAICLALYGQTPRLGRITTGSNEIMSRHKGECHAEVVFETPKGRFLCRWSQHRAYKKPDGALQTQRHEISCFDTGKIFESTIEKVAEHVEKVTGMDFDRFTRAILLAQGRFAAFLQASGDDRAQLLEQITGIGIYSEISAYVHRRNGDELQKLRQLQMEAEGIVILSEEEETKARAELEKNVNDEGASLTGIDKAKVAISWLKGIAGLEKEVNEADEENTRIKSELEQFTPKRERLGLARKAASLDGPYTLLSTTRRELATDKIALTEKNEELVRLQHSAEELKTQLSQTEANLAEVRKNHAEAVPVIQNVRLLDQSIADKKKTIDENLKKITDIREKIAAEEQVVEQKRTALRAAIASQEDVERYLSGHRQDEWLVGGLTGLLEQLKNLLARQKEGSSKAAELSKAKASLQMQEKKLEDAQKKTAERQKEHEQATQELQTKREKLENLLSGRTLGSYRDEAQALQNEQMRLAKIATLEKHRGALEAGEPCPLCGSMEHPYRTGLVPADDEVRAQLENVSSLIRQAEVFEARINERLAKQAEARQKALEAEAATNIAAGERKTATATIEAGMAAYEKLQAEIARMKDALLARLAPLGIVRADLPDEDVLALPEVLQARLARWEEHVRQKTRISDEISAHNLEVERRTSAIKAQTETLDGETGQLEQLKGVHLEESRKREALYGNRDPAKEEEKLNRAISDAERMHAGARERQERLHEELASARALAEASKERISQREPELESQEANFARALVPAGFEDEKRFIEARLSPAELEGLADEEKALNIKEAEILAKIKDRKARLAAEREKNVTDSALTELEPWLLEQEKHLAELRESITGIRHKLARNAEAREKIAAKQKEIEAQEKIQHRWAQLHALIGSADGRKFRNFAQGLTFELMIAHANSQLEKMTDRYILVRNRTAKHPLELSVIDCYQAGEERTTKNLSGGESFIVSLALALGLSGMASRNVRVDSLFLDEGFGTLDEDALDIALTTLAGLNQEGKLIGVISHVSAMKERISAQIQVTPQSGGRSVISGPGVTRQAPGKG